MPRPPFPASSEPRCLLFPRRARPSTLVSAAVSPPRRRPPLHPISHPQARCSSCPHSPPAAPTLWRSACAEAASTSASQTPPVSFDRTNAKSCPSPSLRATSALQAPTPRHARLQRLRTPPDHPAALSTAGPGAPPPPPATGARVGSGGPREPAQGKGRGTPAITPSAPDDEPRLSRGPPRLSRLPMCTLQQACSQSGQSQGLYRRGDTLNVPNAATTNCLDCLTLPRWRPLGQAFTSSLRAGRRRLPAP